MDLPWKYAYFVALGSNLPLCREQKLATIKSALSDLSEGESEVVRCSRILFTPPLPSLVYDTSSHGEYANGLALIRSNLEPHSFYGITRALETKYGHDHTQKWKPRHLDLDILLCFLVSPDEQRQVNESATSVHICSETLQVPHPEILNRPFLVELFQSDFDLCVHKLIDAGCPWRTLE